MSKFNGLPYPSRLQSKVLVSLKITDKRWTLPWAKFNHRIFRFVCFSYTFKFLLMMISLFHFTHAIVINHSHIFFFLSWITAIWCETQHFSTITSFKNILWSSVLNICDVLNFFLPKQNSPRNETKKNLKYFLTTKQVKYFFVHIANDDTTKMKDDHHLF